MYWGVPQCFYSKNVTRHLTSPCYFHSCLHLYNTDLAGAPGGPNKFQAPSQHFSNTPVYIVMVQYSLSYWGFKAETFEFKPLNSVSIFISNSNPFQTFLTLCLHTEEKKLQLFQKWPKTLAQRGFEALIFQCHIIVKVQEKSWCFHCKSCIFPFLKTISAMSPQGMLTMECVLLLLRGNLSICRPPPLLIELPPL